MVVSALAGVGFAKIVSEQAAMVNRNVKLSAVLFLERVAHWLGEFVLRTGSEN
jgi:hypothetical protein